MLTPHLHVLVPEAQWRKKPLGATSFSGEAVEVAPPTDDDVAAVLARVLRQAKKDFADLDAAWPEDEYEKGQRESLQRPLGLELPPTARRRRVAVAHGFSLHADTAVHGNDRQGLERLARYLSPCQLLSSEPGSLPFPLRARRGERMRGRRRVFAYSATTASRPVSWRNFFSPAGAGILGGSASAASTVSMSLTMRMPTPLP
ncbi:MAG: transposase [Draconibacterium sp.]|nr:transposase [Draconibacterium sp.]